MSKGLGKGLSALISEQPANTDAAPKVVVADSEETVQRIPLTVIQPGAYQARVQFNEEELQDLANSIKANGIVQPILLRKIDDSRFEIVAGERRWRASKLAGLEDVPALIMEIDDKKAMEIGLIENVQRQNLNILEEAEGYKRLLDEFKYTQAELAKTIGKSRVAITNTVRLLGLPDKVKDAIVNDQLTAGHARALLTSDQAEVLADTIIKKGLNVRQTEELVRKISELPEEKKTKSQATKLAELTELENNLSRKLGVKVSISNSGETGKVSLSYHSLSELDRILTTIEKGMIAS